MAGLLQAPASSPWMYSPEPVEGGDNSLIRAIRSLQGQLGLRSQQQYGQGQDVFAGGQATVGRGLDTLQQPLDYWSAILSGNKAAMTEALSPEIRRINAGYTQAARTASQFAPSGGGRAALMSQIPFQRAADTSALFAGLRPQAAQQVRGIAGDITNTGLAQLSAALQQMGLSNQQAQVLINSLLGVRRQDLSEDMADSSTISGIGQSIGKLFAPGLGNLISKIPGFGKP